MKYAARKFFVSLAVVGGFLIYMARHGNSTSLPFSGSVPPTTNSAPSNSNTVINGENGGSTSLPDTSNINSSNQSNTNSSASSAGQYRNGTYTGQVTDAYYGLVQVQAVVQNGRISSVPVLQYPNDRRTSQEINGYAVPILQSEAAQAQSSNVDIVSGATLTSEAFKASLHSALTQAL